MSTPFIAAFITAILAFGFYANLSDEVPRLFALGIVLLCFMLDLVLAPWPIQAMILVFVVFGSKMLLPSAGTR